MSEFGNEQELFNRVSEQENKIQFSQFDSDLAWQIGSSIVERGVQEHLPIVVDIELANRKLFHYALHGSSQDNAEWVKRKNRVVNRFGRSSLFMGSMCRLAGQSLEEKFLLPPNKFAAHGGAFPITLAGSGVVGTVTVSGLPQLEDHELVVAVLSEYKSA